MYEKDYVDITGRRVRGGARHHKSMEEKELERRDVELKATMLEKGRQEIEEQFLTPKAEVFVETDEIKELKDRVGVWIDLGYPVHIVGPTGCGKTMLAVHVASKLGRPAVWLNGDEEMTTTHLVGGYGQFFEEHYHDRYIHNVYKSRDVAEPGWVDNPLTIACKYGYTLIYNEFSRAKPEANNILLSVLEERILELPTKYGEERYVKVHPDFKAILTSNSVEYAGVHRPQDALLDRMVALHMNYYNLDTEVEIVKAHAGIPEKEAKNVVKFVRNLREKLPDAEKPGTRACIMIAQGLQAWNGYDKKNYENVCFDVLGGKIKGLGEQSKMHESIKEAFLSLSKS